MKKEVIKEDLSRIKELVNTVLKSEGNMDVERMGGLTNHTYKVTLQNGTSYVIRIPGEGTEEMIVRGDEKKSTNLARELGIDAKLFYFGDDGEKVTEYISGAITMSAERMREKAHMEQAADILKKLHESAADTGVPFEVFDMAAGYEKIIEENRVMMYADYPDVKKEIMKIKEETDSFCDIKKVPCHNDPLCENWVKSGEGKMYLIDWEYAGMNDGIWDLADVSIEAGYSEEEDAYFLKRYHGTKPGEKEWKHFMANKLYVDYLWTLWAKTRVPFDGQPMEDWAEERYLRLKDNLKRFKAVRGGNEV